jgi:hypothetical protein
MLATMGKKEKENKSVGTQFVLSLMTGTIKKECF